MSTTSGPVVPFSTGNSSDFPSGSLSVAILSAIGFSLTFAFSWLRGAQARDDFLEVGFVAIAAPRNDVPQVVVGQVQELAQRRVVGMPHEVALQHDVQLEQAAPALPSQPLSLDSLHLNR